VTELLPRFENAVQVREAIQDVQDDVSRKAVIVAAAKSDKALAGMVNDLIIEKLLAEYHVLELVEQGQAGGWIARAEDGRRKSSESEDILTFPDLNLSDARLSETRKLRKRWSVEELRRLADLKRQEGTWLSRSALLVSDAARLLVESNENEWYTPTQYVEAARRVLGRIDLDPASSEAANETIQAAQFFTADEDGTAQDWHGRIWLNPPYGDWPSRFIGKLVQEFQDGKVTAAVALVTRTARIQTWFSGRHTSRSSSSRSACPCPWPSTWPPPTSLCVVCTTPA
jgi:hypothetical protein